MRTYIYSILIILGSFGLNAQFCDIQVKDLKSFSNTLEIGEHTELVFSIKNNVKNSENCAYAANSVQVYFFLPSTGLEFEKIIFPLNGNGDFMTWTYDPKSKTVIGTNHSPIAHNEGDENVTIRLKATDINEEFSERVVGVSIIQNPDGSVFTSNDASNDNALVTLRLKKSKLFQDLTYKIENLECNVIKISFNSKLLLDKNVELQRSLDGSSFYSIGILETNGVVDDFVFIDRNGLMTDENYTYRLRHVDQTGSENFYTLDEYKNTCELRAPSMNVFPNPALDKIYVSFKNVEDGSRIDLVITNSIGERVMTIPKADVNDIIEVKLLGLSSGVYNINSDNVSIEGKRFIKVN